MVFLRGKTNNANDMTPNAEITDRKDLHFGKV